MYSISVLNRVLKDFERLPDDYTRLISNHIDTLKENPRPHGAKRLRGKTGFSLRVGTYRILYEIDDTEKTVTIYRIKHRRDCTADNIHRPQALHRLDSHRP